jgi:hypothetical protein
MCGIQRQIYVNISHTRRKCNKLSLLMVVCSLQDDVSVDTSN